MRLAVAAWLLLTGPLWADTIRVATFNASLSRKEAGLLVADLLKGDDPQIAKVAAILRQTRPDILLINEIDYDATEQALTLFKDALRQDGPGGPGLDYPHHFTAPVNTGVPSGVDLDGDGRKAGPGDGFGFGFFSGQYGMAVLSRYPLGPTRTFHNLLWQNFPDSFLPVNPDGTPFPSAEARSVMRLSSKSHWDITVETPDGPLHILASHPTPPVFDGPEDRNGRRNHDEIIFWHRYLGGQTIASDQGPHRFDGPHFVLLGNLNADPNDGDGRREAITMLLNHPRLTDPRPSSTGAIEAATGPVNAAHQGDPALDTADWNDTGPGNLRVDYALPSRSLTTAASGVFWPADDEPGYDWLDASDHRLVWVDILLP
ncbi:endonuclease/exonuclease/phosphatase family protein [Halovulum sp. GXIMD14793]